MFLRYVEAKHEKSIITSRFVPAPPPAKKPLIQTHRDYKIVDAE